MGKQGGEFTFAFDGGILPLEPNRPQISVPKASSKLSRVSVESKAGKIPEVAVIKVKRLLDKKVSKNTADRSAQIDFSSTSIIPLPVSSGTKQDRATYKDFCESDGGRFRRIAASTDTKIPPASSIPQPEHEFRGKQIQREREKVLDPRAASSKEIPLAGLEREAKRLVLPKLKGKYNLVEAVSSRAI